MKRRLPHLFIAALLTACSVKPPEPAASTLVAEKFDAIRLSRGMCQGSCPAYDVTVQANGQVNFQGGFAVAVPEQRQSRVPLANVELLGVALRLVKFDEMKEHYQQNEDGCQGVYTDMPKLFIAVTQAGKTREVTLDLGCRPGPTVPFNELVWLASSIDTMAQIGPLIGPMISP